MKLNQKVRYGVGCLYELSKTPYEFVDTHVIATHQNIPYAFAHKILNALSRAGLVHSQKGQGYQLARPLDEITASDVIDVLTADVDPTASNPDLGVLLEKRLNQALSNVTLGELVHSQQTHV